jgi:predicted acylesterase/phospholipase RssA
MYIVISGRLIAKAKDSQQKDNIIGEIGQGECVGEMAILTDKPRSASVFALRDSVLVEFKKDLFFHYAEQNPLPFLALTKVIVKRLERQNNKVKYHNQHNIALVPLTKGIDLHNIVVQMQSYLNGKQRCTSLDSHSVNTQFSFDINSNDISLEQNALLSDFMFSLEKDSQIVFYETDTTLTNWTKKCLSQADSIVFLADFNENEAILVENFDFVQTLRARVEDFPVFLALLHPDGSRLPFDSKTRWLDKIKPKQHFHIRLNEAKDLRRLARSISGHAIGLACGGGGAKGFAEIGVYYALLEANFEIDYVTGVSFGAVCGAGFALGWTKGLEETAKTAFMPRDILGDYRIPFVSLSAGKRVEENIRVHYPGNIEDMWLPFACHSSNLSTSSLYSHREGSIYTAVCASVAIPGVLPPRVIESNYLVDGGLINNLPVDVLYELGCARTIGIDVGSANDYFAESSNQKAPSVWTILKNKITGKKENFPSFFKNIERSMLIASYGHTKEMHDKADLMLSPPVKNFGLTDWKLLSQLIEIGYTHTKKILEAMPEEEKAKFR